MPYLNVGIVCAQVAHFALSVGSVAWCSSGIMMDCDPVSLPYSYIHIVLLTAELFQNQCLRARAMFALSSICARAWQLSPKTVFCSQQWTRATLLELPFVQHFSENTFYE